MSTTSSATSPEVSSRVTSILSDTSPNFQARSVRGSKKRKPKTEIEKAKTTKAQKIADARFNDAAKPFRMINEKVDALFLEVHEIRKQLDDTMEAIQILTAKVDTSWQTMQQPIENSQANVSSSHLFPQQFSFSSSSPLSQQLPPPINASSLPPLQPLFQQGPAATAYQESSVTLLQSSPLQQPPVSHSIQAPPYPELTAQSSRSFLMTKIAEDRALKDRIQALVNQNNITEAKNLLDSILQQQPDQEAALFLRIQLLEESGLREDLAKATQDLTYFIDKYPEQSNFLFKRAAIYDKLGLKHLASIDRFNGNNRLPPVNNSRL